jgi:hypothetical protein
MEINENDRRGFVIGSLHWENRVYTDKLITYSISFDQIEVHHKNAYLFHSNVIASPDDFHRETRSHNVI